MANGQDKELIAVPLQAIINAIQCCEFRVPLLVERSIPLHSQPFRFEGEIRQEQLQFTVVNVFQVPAGMTGAITGLSITEQYVGTLAGTKISIMINGEVSSQYPRVGHNVGIGPGYPAPANIFLKESDQVALFFDCPWTPITMTSAVEIEYGMSFVIEGYYLDKEIFSKECIDNFAVGVLPPGTTASGCPPNPPGQQ